MAQRLKAIMVVSLLSLTYSCKHNQKLSSSLNETEYTDIDVPGFEGLFGKLVDLDYRDARFYIKCIKWKEGVYAPNASQAIDCPRDSNIDETAVFFVYAKYRNPDENSGATHLGKLMSVEALSRKGKREYIYRLYVRNNQVYLELNDKKEMLLGRISNEDSLLVLEPGIKLHVLDGSPDEIHTPQSERHLSVIVEVL